jgi:hypothetical protein
MKLYQEPVCTAHNFTQSLSVVRFLHRPEHFTGLRKKIGEADIEQISGGIQDYEVILAIYRTGSLFLFGKFAARLEKDPSFLDGSRPLSCIAQ